MDASYILCALAAAGLGYLCGSFLTAELVARIVAGKSARALGTGNPGMANVMAQLGKGAGFAVLAGDALKTVLACGLALLAVGPVLGRSALLAAGLGAIVGHNWPVWNGFRGGKGVAVTCVWLMLYLGVPGALCCAAGGVLVLALGYLPLGAVVIPLLAVPVAAAQCGLPGLLGTAAAAGIMFSRHWRGLLRIKTGQEPRFFQAAGKRK